MSFVEKSVAVLGNKIKRLMHPSLDTETRHKKLDELLTRYPLTNQLIWYHIIAARGFLEPEEREAITEAYKIYKELFPDDTTPISEILTVAAIPIGSNRFLRKVGFNYDFALEAPTRFKAAMDELKEGKRHVVSYDHKMWGVEEWVLYDLYNMLAGNHEISSTERILPPFQGKDAKVVITGESIRNPRPERMRGVYEDQIIPLLASYEVVRPGELNFYFGGLSRPNGQVIFTDASIDTPLIAAQK
ncbi:hypothetical protein HYU93_04435 [Candidatus Daviesbacteria bacterium]|nr:hypothetical protein [Candidatus Daviesbacteria bacterium]